MRERTTKRITVTVPVEDAERLQRLERAGAIPSVSSYVAEAIAQRRAREEGLALLERRFGRPSEQTLELVRQHMAKFGQRQPGSAT